MLFLRVGSRLPFYPRLLDLLLAVAGCAQAVTVQVSRASEHLWR